MRGRRYPSITFHGYYFGSTAWGGSHHRTQFHSNLHLTRHAHSSLLIVCLGNAPDEKWLPGLIKSRDRHLTADIPQSSLNTAPSCDCACSSPSCVCTSLPLPSCHGWHTTQKFGRCSFCLLRSQRATADLTCDKCLLEHLGANRPKVVTRPISSAARNHVPLESWGATSECQRQLHEMPGVAYNTKQFRHCSDRQNTNIKS